MNIASLAAQAGITVFYVASPNGYSKTTPALRRLIDESPEELRSVIGA